MDNLVEIFLKQGPTFTIAVVSVFLVGYFIKQERDDRKEEFSKYMDYFEIVKQEMSKATISTKYGSNQTIQVLKLEFGSTRIQVDALVKSLELLSEQVKKDTLELKAKHNGLQNLTSVVMDSMNEHMEKISRVNELKEKLDMTFGQVKILDVKVEREGSHHRANMQKVAEVLGKQAVEIANLKKKS